MHSYRCIGHRLTEQNIYKVSQEYGRNIRRRAKKEKTNVYYHLFYENVKNKFFLNNCSVRKNALKKLRAANKNSKTASCILLKNLYFCNLTLETSK